MSHSLPPISPRLCSCDVHDGHFVDRHVQEIERFIHEEAKELGEVFHNSRKERLGVFKKAFSLLIEESTSFKALLSEINAEYLSVMKAVEEGEQQRSCISRDLKFIIGERITKENYDKRLHDLERKVKLIKGNNEKLRMKCELLKREKIKLCPDMEKVASTNNSIHRSHHVLPGLKLEEQTDIDVLSHALEKLRTDVQNMQESMKTHFSLKERKLLSEQNLMEKEKSKNHVKRYNKALREKVGRLTIALKVCTYIKSGLLIV